MNQRKVVRQQKAGGNVRGQQSSQPLEIDIKKIFLTPPNTLKERITLFAMLLVTFLIFFGPICFSPISPIKAILLSCAPAISISWGWMILLRSLFRKSEFSK